MTFCEEQICPQAPILKPKYYSQNGKVTTKFQFLQKLTEQKKITAHSLQNIQENSLEKPQLKPVKKKQSILNFLMQKNQKSKLGSRIL